MTTQGATKYPATAKPSTTPARISHFRRRCAGGLAAGGGGTCGGVRVGASDWWSEWAVPSVVGVGASAGTALTGGELISFARSERRSSLLSMVVLLLRPAQRIRTSPAPWQILCLSDSVDASVEIRWRG